MLTGHRCLRSAPMLYARYKGCSKPKFLSILVIVSSSFSIPLSTHTSNPATPDLPSYTFTERPISDFGSILPPSMPYYTPFSIPNPSTKTTKIHYSSSNMLSFPINFILTPPALGSLLESFSWRGRSVWRTCC